MNTQIKVDSDLLFRFFNNETTGAEETAVCEWLEESDEHKTVYKNARDLHEAFLLQAPIELFEGGMPESVKRKRRVRRLAWLAAGNVAAVALLCFIGYHAAVGKMEERVADTMTAITVPAGMGMTYTLEDGTDVRLNSGATLQFPLAFSKDRRVVELEGEAYFDVAHDAAKPFVVKTFASDIEVLGTKFNVNADPVEGVFSAALVEGAVRLYNILLPGECIVMHPNEKVILTGGHLVLSDQDAENDIIWTKGFIDISGLDFGQLMKKFEKAFGVRISIERQMSSEPVFDNGKLRISDGIDNALGTIKKGGVEFTYRKDSRTNTIYIK